MHIFISSFEAVLTVNGVFHKWTEVLLIHLILGVELCSPKKLSVNCFNNLFLHIFKGPSPPDIYLCRPHHTFLALTLFLNILQLF